MKCFLLFFFSSQFLLAAVLRIPGIGSSEEIKPEQQNQEHAICQTPLTDPLDPEIFASFKTLYQMLKKNETKDIEINITYNPNCENIFKDSEELNQILAQSLQKQVNCMASKVANEQGKSHLMNLGRLLEDRVHPIEMLCTEEEYEANGSNWIASAQVIDEVPYLFFNAQTQQDDWQKMKLSGKLEKTLSHEMFHLLSSENLHHLFDVPDYTVACKECCEVDAEFFYLNENNTKEEKITRQEFMCRLCGTPQSEFSDEMKKSFYQYASYDYINNFFQVYGQKEPLKAFELFKFLAENNILLKDFQGEYALSFLYQLPLEFLQKNKQTLLSLDYSSVIDKLNHEEADSKELKEKKTYLKNILKEHIIQKALRERALPLEINEIMKGFSPPESDKDIKNLLSLLNVTNTYGNYQLTRYLNQNQESISQNLINELLYEAYEKKKTNPLYQENLIDLFSELDVLKKDPESFVSLKPLYEEELLNTKFSAQNDRKLTDHLCTLKRLSSNQEFGKFMTKFLSRRDFKTIPHPIYQAMIYSTQQGTNQAHILHILKEQKLEPEDSNYYQEYQTKHKIQSLQATDAGVQVELQDAQKYTEKFKCP